jgi:hypothetical protein
MPIFVWIAIAIAILLIGAGTATNLVSQPVADAVDGPVGYGIALGLVALIAVITWRMTEKNKSGKQDD